MSSSLPAFIHCIDGQRQHIAFLSTRSGKSARDLVQCIMCIDIPAGEQQIFRGSVKDRRYLLFPCCIGNHVPLAC